MYTLKNQIRLIKCKFFLNWKKKKFYSKSVWRSRSFLCSFPRYRQLNTLFVLVLPFLIAFLIEFIAHFFTMRFFTMMLCHVTKYFVKRTSSIRHIWVKLTDGFFDYLEDVIEFQVLVKLALEIFGISYLAYLAEIVDVVKVARWFLGFM